MHRMPLRKFIEGVGPSPELATSYTPRRSEGHSGSSLQLLRVLAEKCCCKNFEFFNKIGPTCELDFRAARARSAKNAA